MFTSASEYYNLLLLIKKKERDMINKIKNTDDIKTFVNYLFDKNINFHWDDDFADYVDELGAQSFSFEESEKLNSLMGEALKVDQDFLEMYSLAEFEKRFKGEE